MLRPADQILRTDSGRQYPGVRMGQLQRLSREAAVSNSACQRVQTTSASSLGDRPDVTEASRLELVRGFWGGPREERSPDGRRGPSGEDAQASAATGSKALHDVA